MFLGFTLKKYTFSNSVFTLFCGLSSNMQSNYVYFKRVGMNSNTSACAKKTQKKTHNLILMFSIFEYQVKFKISLK